MKKTNRKSHALYSRWNNIISRCYNKNSKDYKWYGGIGIRVCDRWLDFFLFAEDMYPSYQEGLTLDRKENDKGYSKDNCRWVTMKTQNQNTRMLRSTNTSGYRGVSFKKDMNKWRARIHHNGKEKVIGYYITAKEAGEAYNKYVIDNNLEHTINSIKDNYEI